MKTMKKLVTFFILGLMLLPFGMKVVNAGEEVNTYTVNVTYTFDEENPDIEANLVGQNYGSSVQLTPSTHPGYTWAYWVVNGVVRYDLPQNSSFTVTSGLNLQGVYAPDGSHSVLFLDSNGTVIDSQYVADQGFAVAPELTNHQGKPGLVVHSTVQWRTPMGVAFNPSAPVTSSMVYILQYEVSNVDTYMMTVNGQAAGPYDYNELVTFVADAIDVNDDPFSHWEENGIVLSKNLSYSFTAVKNRTLTAVYSSSPIPDEPIVNLTRDIEQRPGYHTYIGQFYLPSSGYELVEYGFLIDADNTIDLIKSNADYVVPSNSYLEDSNEFVTSFPIGTHMNVRAYFTYKEGTTVTTVYSSLNPRYVQDVTYETGFENSTKTAYALANIDVDGVEWAFDDALIGTSTADVKEGLKSSRITNSGSISTTSAIEKLTSFSFKISKYGLDANATGSVLVSSDSTNWIDVTDSIPGGININSTTLVLYTVDLSSSTNLLAAGLKAGDDLYVKITKSGGTRVNVDTVKFETIYTDQTYLVTFENNGSYSYQQVIENKPLAEPTEPTRSGYAFGGWYLEDTYVTEYNFSNNVTTDFTLYAKWIELTTQYTVSFNSDGGSAVSSELVYENLYATEPADPTKTGYRFDHWALSGNPFVFDSTPITADIELLAIWVEQVTVTFNPGGGTAVDSQTIDINTNATAPANPTREGYRFDYWAVNAEPFSEFVFASTSVSANIELIAIWVEQVTVTFDSNGGTSVPSQTLDIDGLATEPTDPIKPGFDFVEWQDFASNPFDFSTTTIVADITLYATWEESSTNEETILYYTGWEDGTNENAYSSLVTKTSNSVSWDIMYGNIVNTGTPLIGSFNLMVRVAKNTTNIPYTHMTNDFTNKEISKVTFYANGASSPALKIFYRETGGAWIEQQTLTLTTTSTLYTVLFDNTTLNIINIKFQISYGSTSGSNRDSRIDDLTIYGFLNPE